MIFDFNDRFPFVILAFLIVTSRTAYICVMNLRVAPDPLDPLRLRALIRHCYLFFQKFATMLCEVVIISMAVHTPAHRQRRVLINLFHFLDLAVTRLTGHSGRHMRPVIKMYKIRKHMNLYPANGLATLVCIRDFLDMWALRLHNIMAVHTCLEPRNS